MTTLRGKQGIKMENGEKLLLEFIKDTLNTFHSDLTQQILSLRNELEQFKNDFDRRLKEQEMNWFAQHKTATKFEKLIYYTLIVISILIGVLGVKIGGVL